MPPANPGLTGPRTARFADAVDRAAHEWATRRGLHAIDLAVAMRAVGVYEHTDGGNPNERAAGKISSLKPSVVRHALRCGVDVLVSDLDV
eukprot:1195731-Prymnesium_polylepis.1